MYRAPVTLPAPANRPPGHTAPTDRPVFATSPANDGAVASALARDVPAKSRRLGAWGALQRDLSRTRLQRRLARVLGGQR